MLQYGRLLTMPYQEQARIENARYFKAYAEELREKFREGFLSEFTRLRQPQIVVWRNQLIDGKPHKPPFSPKTGKLADIADPDSWGTLDQALKVLESGLYNGLGVVFAKKDGRFPTKRADPFAGIDLDHCVGTNRSIDAWAQKYIDFLQTHTHFSPRDGIHMIMEVGENGLPGPNRKVGKVELFDRNHFLTITPHLVAGTPRTIEPRHLETAYLYLTTVPPQLRGHLTIKNTGGAGAAVPLWAQQTKPKELNKEEKPDEQVIEEALNDERSNFSRYWQGDPTLWTEATPGVKAERDSPSEAFFVLVAMLLTRTHDNEEQVKRLFLKSPFAQHYPKAQRFIGRDKETGRPVTYLESTIRKVITTRKNPRGRD